jgi:hypothetical protein
LSPTVTAANAITAPLELIEKKSTRLSRNGMPSTSEAASAHVATATAPSSDGKKNFLKLIIVL